MTNWLLLVQKCEEGRVGGERGKERGKGGNQEFPSDVLQDWWSNWVVRVDGIEISRVWPHLNRFKRFQMLHSFHFRKINYIGDIIHLGMSFPFDLVSLLFEYSKNNIGISLKYWSLVFLQNQAFHKSINSLIMNQIFVQFGFYFQNVILFSEL